jgi:hypothetical protein
MINGRQKDKEHNATHETNQQKIQQENRSKATQSNGLCFCGTPLDSYLGN